MLKLVEIVYFNNNLVRLKTRFAKRIHACKYIYNQNELKGFILKQKGNVDKIRTPSYERLPMCFLYDIYSCQLMYGITAYCLCCVKIALSFVPLC